ncbi:MAG: NAD-dependent epimerase/dehydratase family protein, partial [Thermoplasmata archaeon]|nr:NAD-dependent epimerase/dehydratase family protein [Thermoplasmata archaeon]
MKAIVTGGCGFIASHVVDRLVSHGHDVTVIDNMSTGFRENLKHHLDSKKIRLIEFDLSDLKKLEKAIDGADAVFHLAANADVRHGLEDNFRDIERNLITTYNVLEAMRKNDVRKILFSSTAATYGEPDVFPTPETYHPRQTSFYGASKIACEGLIESFSEAYGMQAWMYRFVSIQGERHPHGVTYDFVRKLNANPKELEILGDGTARKSYLYVEDCVDGFFAGFEKSGSKVNLFNLGHQEHIAVKNVADIICDEMGLGNVRYTFTGGERGWIGDSPLVHLGSGRMRALGWYPKVSIEETVRRTVRWLVANPYVYSRETMKSQQSGRAR